MVWHVVPRFSFTPFIIVLRRENGVHTGVHTLLRFSHDVANDQRLFVAGVPQVSDRRLTESFVAPEPVAAPSVAPPTPREPAAPVAQAGAKGRRPTFVQGEFWW